MSAPTPDEMRAIQARDLLTEDITRFLLAEFGQPVAWVDDELGTPQEWISVVGDGRKIAEALVERFAALSANPTEETNIRATVWQEGWERGFRDTQAAGRDEDGYLVVIPALNPYQWDSAGRGRNMAEREDAPMTSDTARRHPAQVQAEEKYPHYVAPSWEDGATKEDVMPSVDASWQNADADMQRAAFLAGWDAAIEHSAQVAETHHAVGSDGESVGTHPLAVPIATAIRAGRSDHA